MANGIDARPHYGGLLLTCDEGTFARLRDHILAEPSVAETAGTTDRAGLRFVSVRMPPADPPSRGPHWFFLVPIIGGALLCFAAQIIGFIAMARWLTGG